MGARVAPLPSGRGRVWLVIGLALIAFVAVRGFVAWSDARGRTASAPATSTALPGRTIQAGPVTVKITPQSLSASGATFKIAFDNHSIDLNNDVAGTSKLVVAGTTWPVAGWSGDGPGGHHREGTLRFSAGGPATGDATLTLGGLPQPVVASWTLKG